MKVTMLCKVSGTRDGQDWPDRGEVVDLPDDEAKATIAAGLAAPVVATAKEEPETKVAETREKRKG